MIKIVSSTLNFVDHILSAIQCKNEALCAAVSAGGGVHLDTLQQGLALISCADMSIALVPIRAVTSVNTARFAFPIFTIFALKIVRSIVDITDTILTISISSTLIRSDTLIVTTLVSSLAVRVSIAATPVRLSTSSTDWFVLWTLPIIRTPWFTDVISITIVTGVIRPRLITCIRRTVSVSVTTFLWFFVAFM